MDYGYYANTYHGTVVPENEFPALLRDAQATLERYKRIYTVKPLGEDSENMALCSMIDALYYFLTIENGEVASSVSVGSVSSSTSSQVDISPAAKSRELYRCARLYLDIYRGC